MKEESNTAQVKLWALAGPLISLFCLFVLCVKNGIEPIYFPLIILFGVPLCWKWKLWGASSSILALIGLMAVTYSEIPLEERFWFIGMGASIALSLLISALSFDEMEAIFNSVALESRSRLENLWKVDEKKKFIEEDLTKKKEQIRDLQIKVKSFQKLVDLSTDEMLESRLEQAQLTQELKQIQDELEILKTTMPEPNPVLEGKYKQLREQFQEKSQTLNQTRRELFVSNEKLLKLERDYEELRLFSMNEVEQALESHMQAIEAERESHEREVEVLENLLEERMKG